jgi:hypothetical protein
MNSHTTPTYWACQLSDLDAIQRFRREAFAADRTISQPPCPELICDRWDQSAVHLGLFYGNRLVGAVRFARSLDGNLPLHDRMPAVERQEPIREISRLLIHPEHRNFIGSVVFARKIYEYILCSPSNLLADVINRDGHPMRGQLMRVGFTDTGLRYWDECYRAEKAILWGRQEIVITKIKQFVKNSVFKPI